MLGYAARFPLQDQDTHFPTAWSAVSWCLIAEFNPGLGSPPGNHLAPGITLSLGAVSTQWVHAGPLDWNWDTWEGPSLIQSTNGIMEASAAATSNRPLLPFLPYRCYIGEQFPINHPYANPCLRSASEGPDLPNRGLSEWKLLIECPRLFTKTNCPAIHIGYWLDKLPFCEDTSWA